MLKAIRRWFDANIAFNKLYEGSLSARRKVTGRQATIALGTDHLEASVTC